MAKFFFSIRRFSIIGILSIFFCCFLLHFYLPTIVDESQTNSKENFELFWTFWMRNPSEFRARRRLVIDSLLIHHPRAILTIFSSTLNDTSLFLHYRQRGFQISVVNCSNNEFSKFSILQQFGGTFFDLNFVFLNTLPNVEFRSDSTLFRFRPGRTSINVTNVSSTKFPSPQIFDRVEFDTSLEFDDLSRRRFGISFSNDDDQKRIARGSLIDFLFDRYDLNERGFINSSSQLIHPVIYIDTRRKQGRFTGRDVIYLRTKTTDQVWNLTIDVNNGELRFPMDSCRMTNCNQAEINWILHEMIYRPFVSTKTDRLMVETKNDRETLKISIRILIFQRQLSILTKTMGTEDRWPAVQRLVESVENYFPSTSIHIASDSGEPIDIDRFFNSSEFDRSNRHELKQNVFIHNLPMDSGLSRSRNFLVDQSQTPFVFIIDDDFVFDDDSHLDFLLEIIFLNRQIDIIGGKIPEDIEIYRDFAGFFLFYNETIELVDEIPTEKLNVTRFHRREQNETINPCRQVDFLPNVFLGRTKILASIRWDDELKLAEHEDFFLRFAQSNRTVFTCRHIAFHHRQQPWWEQIEQPYYKKRGRVYEFYQKMLKKHRLKRLISFDVTNLDLDQIEK